MVIRSVAHVVFAELASRGCRPIGEIAAAMVGRQVFIENPSGIWICLIEHEDGYRDKHLK